MDEVVAGIREGELAALSLEVSDYARRISGIFSKIDGAMMQLKNCYQGEPADKLMERYGEIKSLFPVVKNNISSYSDDLMAIIRKMNAGDKRLTGLFEELTSDVKSQIRKQ